jgi:8-oxo-dGTP pyrophosphatase MutT (NUDIX family)
MDQARSRQVAALPIRLAADGTILILLVTSRETKRWIIPKGWPWRDRDDWTAAAEEAREEAGVLGHVQSDPIGFFTYDKRRADTLTPVRVAIYQLDVTDVLEDWPEQRQRQRAWFTPAVAASLVVEPELQQVLRGLAASSCSLC